MNSILNLLHRRAHHQYRMYLNNSSIFSGFTLPPYWMTIFSATSSEVSVRTTSRICAHTSFASSLEAVFPVPIAQIGSYAIIVFSTCSSPILVTLFLPDFRYVPTFHPPLAALTFHRRKRSASSHV